MNIYLYFSDIYMIKKESLIGVFLFASFLYGINNILKITLNVHETQNTREENKIEENKIEENKIEENKIEENKTNADELNKIDILMEEIDTIKKYDLSKVNIDNDSVNVHDVDNDNPKITILESSMIRTIENDIVMVNKMIEKKQYLIELNDKLIEIKKRLTKLKNEMEFDK